MPKLTDAAAVRAACPHPADRLEVTEPELGSHGSPDLRGGVVCTDCGADLGSVERPARDVPFRAGA